MHSSDLENGYLTQVNPWISKHAQQAAVALDLEPWFSTHNTHLQILPYGRNGLELGLNPAPHENTSKFWKT